MKPIEHAFEQAIAAGDLEAVEALLPKLLKQKKKLIFQAIEKADCALVRLLIDSGVSLEQRHFGGTPLLTALFELTEIECLAEFHEKKPRLIEIICLLVERGADVNVRAPDGVSALRLAFTLSDPQIPNFLISKGAEP